MANIPRFKNEDYIHKPVDFDLKKVYSIPLLDNMIFMFTNYDRCKREIMEYEEGRRTSGPDSKHPIHFKPQALALLKCHSKNMKFEPVCLDAFNDARECLFQTDGAIRLCENELHLFEECQHDPVAFAEFLNLATIKQAKPKVHGWTGTAIRNTYA